MEQIKVNGIGKKIIAITLTDDNVLVMRFDDGTGVRLEDDGQSCCESRYMRTDDSLIDCLGAELRAVEIRSAPPQKDDEDYCHEVQFLALVTDRGECVFSSHNEHNGYYGGFWIKATDLPTLPKLSA